MSRTDELEALAAKIREGGAPKYHQSNAQAGKMFCRARIAALCDDGGAVLPGQPDGNRARRKDSLPT